MFNTSVSNALPDVTVTDGVWLTLTPLSQAKVTTDTKATSPALSDDGALVFIVNPDEESWNFKANFAKVAVLNTAQPIANYLTSDTSFSLPKVRLYSPNNAKNLQPIIDQLEAFTKPVKAGENPPLLKLTYGDLTLSRVYLESADVTIKARIGGFPTLAEAKLGFIISPEAAKVKVVEALPGDTKQLNPILAKQTEREQSLTLQQLVAALLDNKFGVLAALPETVKKKVATIEKAKITSYTAKTFFDAGITLTDKGQLLIDSTVVFGVEQVKEITGIDFSKKPATTPTGEEPKMVM
jgi:hypothetical protein